MAALCHWRRTGARKAVSGARWDSTGASAWRRQNALFHRFFSKPLSGGEGDIVARATPLFSSRLSLLASPLSV